MSFPCLEPTEWNTRWHFENWWRHMHNISCLFPYSIYTQSRFVCQLLSRGLIHISLEFEQISLCFWEKLNHWISTSSFVDSCCKILNVRKLFNILSDGRDYSRVSRPARCGCKCDIRSSLWSGHNCPEYICKLFNIPVSEMCSVFVHVKLFNYDVKPGISGPAKVSLTAGRNVLPAVPAASWSQLKSVTYSLWLLEATASFWAVSRPAHH
jgi:hypothetical protein